MLRALDLTKEEKEAIRYLSFPDPKSRPCTSRTSMKTVSRTTRTSIRFAPSPSRKGLWWCRCAAVEADIAELDDEERDEFMAELGLEEPGLNRVIRAGYALLNLQTYFTAGVKEVRAWTIPVGATAPQAAGKIHTDFEKALSARRPSLMKTSLPTKANRARKKPVKCVLKVKTTS